MQTSGGIGGEYVAVGSLEASYGKCGLTQQLWVYGNRHAQQQRPTCTHAPGWACPICSMLAAALRLALNPPWGCCAAKQQAGEACACCAATRAPWWLWRCLMRRRSQSGPRRPASQVRILWLVTAHHQPERAGQTMLPCVCRAHCQHVHGHNGPQALDMQHI